MTHRRGAQQGVVLFVALIVLVIMALAGVAMIRQAGTSLGVTGNIALRQNATTGADFGTEAAIAWFRTRSQAQLAVTDATAGYYSEWGTGTERQAGDPALYNWDALTSASAGPADQGGNNVRYIIERLCERAGELDDAPTQHCVKSESKGEGFDRSGTCAHYASGCFSAPKVTHYRVSARTIGPRQTTSYIQVMFRPE